MGNPETYEAYVPESLLGELYGKPSTSKWIDWDMNGKKLYHARKIMEFFIMIVHITYPD